MVATWLGPPSVWSTQGHHPFPADGPNCFDSGWGGQVFCIPSTTNIQPKKDKVVHDFGQWSQSNSCITLSPTPIDLVNPPPFGILGTGRIRNDTKRLWIYQVRRLPTLPTEYLAIWIGTYAQWQGWGRALYDGNIPSSSWSLSCRAFSPFMSFLCHLHLSFSHQSPPTSPHSQARPTGKALSPSFKAGLHQWLFSFPQLPWG